MVRAHSLTRERIMTSVNLRNQAIALKTRTSRHTDLNSRVAVHCRSLRGFREVLLKEILRALRAFLSQNDRFCLGGGIRDVTFLMESIEGIPIVTLPCPAAYLVLKCGQVQQSQHRFVDLFFINFDFHEAPLWPERMNRTQQAKRPCLRQRNDLVDDQ